MRKFFSYIVLSTIFCASVLSAICPYPLNSKYGNFPHTTQSLINDFFENENDVEFTKNTLSVLNLEWEVVDKIFQKYVDTDIIDVLSEERFIIQRTGGVNHADIETINSDNTQILQKIIKSSSISRRAVWIKINNVWLAGSISIIPHGYSLITDNELDGHLCLHFFNSKTDNTKKIDYSHQKAISYALKHSKSLEKIISN